MIKAVLDADVLYALPIRDTLLSAAAEGCYIPLWSDMILDEAITNLLAHGRLSPASATSLRKALDTHFADALIDDYRPLIPKMRNHPKDRHVAACAAAGEADYIVTGNLTDFRHLPDGIKAIHPDAFLCRLLDDMPGQLRAALDAQSARLRNPPLDVAAIIALLAPVTPRFVQAWHAGETA
jgi:predicted nucleic acid-binding protein